MAVAPATAATAVTMTRGSAAAAVPAVDVAATETKVKAGHAGTSRVLSATVAVMMA